MTTLMARAYGGTGLSLEDLDALPRHERESIVAGTISMLRGQLAELRTQLLESEGMLRQAMLERGATVADAGAWTVKLTTRRSYAYDEEMISALQAFVDPDVYDDAVRRIVTTKINKTKLNALAKRGGEIAAIIEAATTDVVDGYTLEVSRA
jgi:hypothetical protein